MGRTPLDEVAPRLPEQGRIRMGEKHGKGMRAIDKFRFTSPDEVALQALAELYGGTVRPWDDPRASRRNQFELYSDASRIEVVIPPWAVTTQYEMWGGGGIERRCDGRVCTVFQRGRTFEQQCVCTDAGPCRPYTRVNCILPRLVKFGGTWRLESHGRNAHEELSAMQELLAQVQEIGGRPVLAYLTIDKRTSRKGGETNHFVVPKLEFGTSLQGLMAGEGAVTAEMLGAPTPPMAALPQGSLDDEVVDAEILEDDEVKPTEWGEKIQARFKGDTLADRLLDGAHEVSKVYPFLGTDEQVLDRLVELLTARLPEPVTTWSKAEEKVQEGLERLLRDILNNVVALRQEGDALRIVRI